MIGGIGCKIVVLFTINPDAEYLANKNVLSLAKNISLIKNDKKPITRSNLTELEKTFEARLDQLETKHAKERDARSERENRLKATVDELDHCDN